MEPATLPNASQQTVQVKKDYGAIPAITCSPSQLNQVFLNLITIAMAAMETGGTLTVRSFRERTTRRAVAQFQDTGVGIPPDQIDHIFEPFFTTKPEGQGTGLGLFVSYGIITRLRRDHRVNGNKVRCLFEVDILF